MHKQNQGENSHDHFNRCTKRLKKIQHPFIIKAPKKLGIEDRYFSIIKALKENL
jgi:hypothetical protein